MGVDAQQTVSIEGGPTGGSFTLDFEGQSTSILPVGSEPPSAEEVESALSALPAIAVGNVSVARSGSLPETVTYTVTFQGALATKSVSSLVCDDTALGGSGAACNVATTTQGVGGSVYKFDATGKPVDFFALAGNQLTGTSTPAGFFSFPLGVSGTPAAVAVDNSKSTSDPSVGDLYVMDAGNGVIDKFSPSGEYLSQITDFGSRKLLGLAVDANGTVRVDLATGKTNEVVVDEFDDSSANYLVAEQSNPETFPFTGVPDDLQAHGFAVGPTGDDYLLYESCGCTGKFGQQLAGLGAIDSDNSGDVAIAADPQTNHVYVDRQSEIIPWDTGR